VLDWRKRSEAERLRQWPLIVHAAETAANMAEVDGVLLLGSFAAGRADQISDVDLVAVVTDGRFDDAWARRRELETDGTLYRWDVHIESDGDAASHKWITQDIVKVECGFADPARSAMQLAEPYAVIVGGESVATRFPPLEPIPPDVLEAYAQELRDKGMVPEVEAVYGELRRALRRAASGDC
jgi:predicted nucleotidyltransferase